MHFHSHKTHHFILVDALAAAIGDADLNKTRNDIMLRTITIASVMLAGAAFASPAFATDEYNVSGTIVESGVSEMIMRRLDLGWFA